MLDASPLLDAQMPDLQDTLGTRAVQHSCALLALTVMVSGGCQPSAPSQTSNTSTSAPAASPTSAPTQSARAEEPKQSPDAFTKVPEAVGATGSQSLPARVVADGDCPILYPPPDEEIAAQAKAKVPLTPGLTLSHLWRRGDTPEDIECLTNIVRVEADAITSTASCIWKDAAAPSVHRICRKDLRGAHVYHTKNLGSTSATMVGTTKFSLSHAAFTQLKRQGHTTHLYFGEYDDGGGRYDLEGTLKLDGTDALPTIVNDESVRLAVLRLSGTLRGSALGKPATTRVSAAVLDDERFPLMLDYRLLDLGSFEFSIRYTKISYPAEGELEKHLVEERRVDVYGIYFDFASDGIRKESEPVLKEIGDVLKKNSAWTLSIGGHTDNVGSDAANLELSQRRSTAVRVALVQRYGIAADRLTSAGYGEGAPKDTNDTPEGRARNRRVELVRVD